MKTTEIVPWSRTPQPEAPLMQPSAFGTPPRSFDSKPPNRRRPASDKLISSFLVQHPMKGARATVLSETRWQRNMCCLIRLLPVLSRSPYLFRPSSSIKGFPSAVPPCRMEVGMKPLNGKYFVQGVKAFELKTPIKDFPPDKDRSRAR